ncbi:hypothetical protein SNE32_02105 [Lysobacter sp. D1-1-M9]
MNIPTGAGRHDPDLHDEAFDRAVRARHAEALRQVPASIHARLRAHRHATANGTASSVSGTGWRLAGLCAAVFALALGLQHFTAPSMPPSTPPPLDEITPVAQVDLAVAALDENPDLYLWLAANDDALPPAPEQ